LRLLTARVDRMERGWTSRAETALTESYLTASSTGWLSKVAHVSSLLASMMIVAGKAGSEGYARMVLAVANTLPEAEAARFVFLNLAVAKLEAGVLKARQRSWQTQRRLLEGGLSKLAWTSSRLSTRFWRARCARPRDSSTQHQPGWAILGNSTL
jgi:hypothetical protein